MPISVETVIYVPAREAGSEAPRHLALDPLPLTEDGPTGVVQIENRIVAVADLRQALDRAEDIQQEDGQ